jgi:predicted transcriptional regulator of viral defense system
MKIIDAMKALDRLSNKFGRHVFSKNDLRVVFPDENEASLSRSLERLTKNGVLHRPVKGVFVYAHSSTASSRHYLLEQIASTMRQFEVNYVSLESALSEHGAISQVPINYLSVMTTGRSGLYETPHGVIEFTHTKKNEADIIRQCVTDPERPLPMANAQMALADLKRVGRNLNMVDQDFFEPQKTTLKHH